MRRVLISIVLAVFSVLAPHATFGAEVRRLASVQSQNAVFLNRPATAGLVTFHLYYFVPSPVPRYITVTSSEFPFGFVGAVDFAATEIDLSGEFFDKLTDTSDEFLGHGFLL